MAKLKVGNTVKIKRSSEYFVDGEASNPKDTQGVIVGDDGSDDHNFRVEWSNGHTNVYNKKDLKLADKVKENLLTEILYTDCCDDVLEVDTSMRGQVYISAGDLDSDGDFDSSKTIELNVEDVKKVRKQLKAWLDKHHPSV